MIMMIMIRITVMLIIIIIINTISDHPKQPLCYIHCALPLFLPLPSLILGERHPAVQTVWHLCVCVSPLSPQSVQSAASSPARTRVSAATASAWATALSPTTTWRAPPASTTTTRAAACRTALRAPTSLRDGAASPWTCALKCTCSMTLSLSSTGENACLNAPPASHAMRQIRKDAPFTSELWWCV